MMKLDVDVTVGWSEIVQQHFPTTAKSLWNKTARSIAKVMGLFLLFQVVWAARQDAELDAGGVRHTVSLLTLVGYWKGILG